MFVSRRCPIRHEPTTFVLLKQTSIGCRSTSAMRCKRCSAYPVIGPRWQIDQFSHRLFEAVGRFQEANGFPASGILTSAQIDRIHEIADPTLAYWQLRMVRHPAVGLPLWVPLGVGFNQIPTRSGIDFENANKIASLSFNFFPNGNLGSTYSRLVNFGGFRPVYSKMTSL